MADETKEGHHKPRSAPSHNVVGETGVGASQLSGMGISPVILKKGKTYMVHLDIAAFWPCPIVRNAA
jgi:hypothetical protein